MARRIDHYRESVWHDRDLSTSEKLLLLALSRFMDFDTLGGAHPGHARLQELTSLSKRSIERRIQELEEKGWLVCDHRGGSGKGRRREASVYRGIIPDHRPADGGEDAPTNATDWRHHDASTGVTVSPDWRHHDAPPSQGPAAPIGGRRLRGVAAGAGTQADSTSANTPTPCDDSLECNGTWHMHTGTAEPCPHRHRHRKTA